MNEKQLMTLVRYWRNRANAIENPAWLKTATAGARIISSHGAKTLRECANDLEEAIYASEPTPRRVG